MALAFVRKWSGTFDFLNSRKTAYRAVFQDNGYGQTVTMDLMRHCHATETTFDKDPQVHAFKEGQKDVWLRIQRHLSLTPEQLFVIYNHPSVIAKYMEDDHE